MTRNNADEQPADSLLSGAPLEDAAGSAGLVDQPVDGSSGGAHSHEVSPDDVAAAKERSRTGVEPAHAADRSQEGGYDVKLTEAKAHERAFMPAGEEVDEPVEHLRDITGKPGGGLEEDVEGGTWGADDEARDKQERG